MREKMVSRCLPYPEIEKMEGFLFGELIFFVSGLFYTHSFRFLPDMFLIVKRPVRINRQVSSQKEKKPCDISKNTCLVIISKIWRKKDNIYYLL